MVASRISGISASPVVHAAPRAVLYAANYESFFTGAVGRVSGSLAKKCLSVAARGVWFVGPRDAVVLYEPLDPAFAEYVAAIYGYEPKVFAPRLGRPNLSEPLSLFRRCSADQRLLEEMREYCLAHMRRVTVTPFISSPVVYDFTDSLGVMVSGPTESLVTSGLIDRLNDKRVFQSMCSAAQITVPPGSLARGWSDLLQRLDAAMTYFDRVMLRQPRSAGGLGNCEIIFRELRTSPTLVDGLRALGVTDRDWDTDVLVERVMRVAHSPTFLFSIVGGRIELVAHTERLLKGSASLGGIMPSQLSKKMYNHAFDRAHAFMELASRAANGELGYIDIDLGVMPSGSVVGFECNARFTGNNHVAEMRRRLCGPDHLQTTVSRSYDALKVPPDFTMAKAIAWLKERPELNWDSAKKSGVIITTPPVYGSMGFVAMGSDRPNVDRMFDAMMTLEP